MKQTINVWWDENEFFAHDRGWQVSVNTEKPHEFTRNQRGLSDFSDVGEYLLSLGVPGSCLAETRSSDLRQALVQWVLEGNRVLSHEQVPPYLYSGPEYRTQYPCCQEPGM